MAEIQQSRQETSAPQLSMAAVAATARGLTSGNSLLMAQGILTGVYKAIDTLTKDQSTFFSKMTREPELNPGVYSSMAHVISMTALGEFSRLFTLGDSPVAKELITAAREKVNASEKSLTV